MKKSAIALALLAIMTFSSASQADDILTLGKYVMNDGVMKVEFEVKQISNGRYFIEGGGSNGAGAMCMMNGVGEFKNGLFGLGYQCFLKLSSANGKLEIKDEKPCTPCDPGAYITGIYEKQ